MAKASAKQKRKKLHVPKVIVHIAASFNNTKIMVTTPEGHAISWGSAGHSGFKGARKSTPYAAQIAVETAMKPAVEAGASTAEVRVRGPGSGREAAIRAVSSAISVLSVIRDVTPIPHNGARAKKKRRV